MSSDTIRQVQQQLTDKGHNPGPVDGILGAQTKSALKDFQQAQGIDASGNLDQKTLAALGVDSSSSGSTSGSTSSGSPGMSGSTSTPSGTTSGSPSGSTSGSPSGSTSGSPSGSTGGTPTTPRN